MGIIQIDSEFFFYAQKSELSNIMLLPLWLKSQKIWNLITTDSSAT